jgi:deoxyhypusine monooxygenase
MVATAVGDEAVIARLKAKLEAGGLTLPQKYHILCSLRNCSNSSVLNALLVALRDSSALYRHDIAFSLGQRQDATAVQALIQILADSAEHCIVRHEAAEALGAIGTPECVEPLRWHCHSSVQEVAETCALAMQRMDYFARLPEAEQPSRFQSVDPTPPYPSATPLQELSDTLEDEAALLFNRYRALFALRNRGGDAAVASLARCLRSSQSALLKHEVAYVLGQMLHSAGVACLKAALQVRITGNPLDLRSRRPLRTRS